MPQRTFLHRVLCLTAAAMLLMPCAALAGASTENTGVSKIGATPQYIRPVYPIEKFCDTNDIPLSEWIANSDVVFEGYLSDLHKSLPEVTPITNQCFAFFDVRAIFKGKEQMEKFDNTENAVVWGKHAAKDEADEYDMNLCKYKRGKRYVVFSKADVGARRKELHLLEALNCTGSRDYSDAVAEAIKAIIGKE